MADPSPSCGRPQRLSPDFDHRENHNADDKSLVDSLLTKIKYLQKRVVEQEGDLGSERLRNETLQTKLEVLLECYRLMDEDLTRHWHETKWISHHEKDGDAAVPPSYLKLALKCADLRCKVAQLEEDRKLNDPDRKPHHEVNRSVKFDKSALYNKEMRNTDPSLLECLRKARLKLKHARYYGVELHNRLVAASRTQQQV